MSEFTAPSGAKVVINVAPFVKAKNLKKAVQKEIKFEGDIDFSQNWILAQLCNADSSDIVDAALWPCLIHCTYNDAKIVPEIFDNKDARIDYYDIVMACLKENLGPLMEGLSLKLFEMGILKKRAENLKSE